MSAVAVHTVALLVKTYELHCGPERHFRLPWGNHHQNARQCMEQTSVPVQNVSQIRLAVSEEICLEHTDRQTEKQTANLISPVTVGDITIKQMAIPYLKLTEMLSLSEQNVGISIELQYICKQASVFAK